MRKIVIGGGTFAPVANHLSLCAPAFGGAARYISSMLDAELVLTKMADPQGHHPPVNGFKLSTNKDVSDYIDTLIEDPDVKLIVLSVAFCDFEYPGGDFHGDRVKTADGDMSLDVKVAEKVIDKIRRARPDIFLVGFKTTTNATTEEQFLSGLNMMKRAKCNLVLANDTVTRNNIIITPEETYYGDTTDRKDALYELCVMVDARMKCTYTRTVFNEQDSYPASTLHPNMQQVLRYLIDNGGYIENNGRGFTPGHFCERTSENAFLSSQRLADHNRVFEEGMSLVRVNGEQFEVFGRRKASVGARSQWLMLKNNPDYPFIIHTHNPLKLGSRLNLVPQKPFQCGSTECGMNTLNGLQDFGNGILAVYLHKHGINMMFRRDVAPQTVIDFLNNNVVLGKKVT